MNQQDIRWQQRFQNYKKALAQLQEAVDLHHERALSNIERQGFIKAFEFTHELAWNVMKDYFQYQGNTGIMGSRDATREAFHNQIIKDGTGWMDMIQTRNRAVHTYENTMVDDIIHKIVDVYAHLFINFDLEMQKIADKYQP